MRKTHVIKRKPVRFRLIVLLAVLGLVASLYLLLRQDRLDSELQDGVMLRDADRVHAALESGANARGRVAHAKESIVFEKLLRGQNPLMHLAPQARGGGASGSYNGPATDNTLLMYAAVTRSPRILEDLLDHGADIEARGGNGTPAVFQCIGKGELLCLEILLRHGARVNIQNDAGKTALHIAAGTDSVDAVRALLDRGGDIRVKDHKGTTPLLAAARAHAATACLLLLDRGGDPADLRDPTASLPIGANEQWSGFTDRTPVPPRAWAAAKGAVPFMERLWQRVLTPDEKRNQGPHALYQAILARQLETSAYLLKLGVSPNAQVEVIPVSETNPRTQATTVIGGGTSTRTAAAAPRLVTAGSGIQRMTNQAFRLPLPLSVAAANRDIKMCKLLLAHGAAINGHSDGSTPLMAAVRAEAVPNNGFARGVAGPSNLRGNALKGVKSYPTVRFLLANGADVHGASGGMTALMEAVQDPDLVDLLLSRGADARERGRGGQTALMAACSANILTVERLIKADAAVNDSDAQGLTPLMYAVRNYRPGEAARTVRLLLKHGADPNARDKRMQTALMYARPATTVVVRNGVPTQTIQVNEVEAVLTKAHTKTIP